MRGDPCRPLPIPKRLVLLGPNQSLGRLLSLAVALRLVATDSRDSNTADVIGLSNNTRLPLGMQAAVPVAVLTARWRALARPVWPAPIRLVIAPEGAWNQHCILLDRYAVGSEAD